MAEQSAAVLPGRATQVSSALPAGTTLYNGDDEAALYVSAHPNPGPGNGFRIGPKGSVEWTTDGSPVHAAPDAGVTKTLTLTMTDNVGSPVNPVDVGAAVAAQLLAKGVPSVLTGEEVPWVSGTATIDVSRFASLTVQLFKPAAGSVFYEFFSGGMFGSSVVMGSRLFTMARDGYLTFTVDVIGPLIVIGGSGISNVRIFGTNRKLGNKVLSADTAFNAAPNIAWTNGTTTPISADGFTTDGGLHTVRLAVTNNGRGFLTYKGLNHNGTLVDQISVHTGMNEGSPNPVTPAIMEVNRNIILPPGLLTFGFLSYVTGSFQVVLQVTPQT